MNSKELVYKDPSSFKTYRMKCLRHEMVPAFSPGGETSGESKFLVFSRTQCGEELYQCVYIRKHGRNIRDFQIGSKTEQSVVNDGSEYSHEYSRICNEQYFDDSHWITQTRLDHGLSVAPCPIDGEYEGLIPDADGLCAKLWSECHAPDIMFYQVSSCDNNEVFEGKCI